MNLFNKKKYTGEVKVLKKGTLPGFIGTCNFCGAIVSAKHGSHKIIGIGGGTYFMTIKCPTEGCENFISAENRKP